MRACVRVCVCVCVAGEAFDVVVCSEVLEHVSDLALMVRDLCKLVRKKDEGGVGGGGVSSSRMAAPGVLYITTINRTNISYGLGMPHMFVSACFLFYAFSIPTCMCLCAETRLCKAIGGRKICVEAHVCLE